MRDVLMLLIALLVGVPMFAALLLMVLALAAGAFVVGVPLFMLVVLLENAGRSWTRWRSRRRMRT